jgi:hypothetical protein
MTYDASNTKHIAKAEKAAKSANARANSFVRLAMSSIEGRAYFLQLLERCNVFASPFTANANATAFNCGIQNVGLWLIADIMREAPDAYILMMREREDGRRSTSNDGSSGDSPDDGGPDNDSSGNGHDAAAEAGDYLLDT